MRRWMWGAIALIVIAVLVVVVLGRLSARTTALPEDVDTILVQRRQLVASISASGSVSPVAQVLLNFNMPGAVSEVSVVEGQQVQQGEELARLESAELELAIRQAEQVLTIQQIAYDQTMSPRKEDVDAARASLASAQANLRALIQPDPLQLDIARHQAEAAT